MKCTGAPSALPRRRACVRRCYTRQGPASNQGRSSSRVGGLPVYTTPPCRAREDRPPRIAPAASARCRVGERCGARCYLAYHDDEWGRPDRRRRASLREARARGFQSGLSVDHDPPQARALPEGVPRLRRRHGWRASARRDVQRLLADAGIVRHRGKIEAAIPNAARRPRRTATSTARSPPMCGASRPTRAAADRPRTLAAVPTTSPPRRRARRRSPPRGFRFVGPTTVYAFMQAMGLVNDHVVGCAARAPATRAWPACARQALPRSPPTAARRRLTTLPTSGRGGYRPRDARRPARSFTAPKQVNIYPLEGDRFLIEATPARRGPRRARRGRDRPSDARDRRRPLGGTERSLHCRLQPDPAATCRSSSACGSPAASPRRPARSVGGVGGCHRVSELVVEVGQAAYQLHFVRFFGSSAARRTRTRPTTRRAGARPCSARSRACATPASPTRTRTRPLIAETRDAAPSACADDAAAHASMPPEPGPASDAPIRDQRVQGLKLRGEDLNLRPSGYEPDELPDCSTPRHRSPCGIAKATRLSARTHRAVNASRERRAAMVSCSASGSPFIGRGRRARARARRRPGARRRFMRRASVRSSGLFGVAPSSSTSTWTSPCVATAEGRDLVAEILQIVRRQRTRDVEPPVARRCGRR